MDYLWDFFYEKSRDEHGTGAGRSNLDILISGVLDTIRRMKVDSMWNNGAC